MVLFGLPQPARLLRAFGLKRADRRAGNAPPSLNGHRPLPRVGAVLAVVGLNGLMVYTHFLALQRVEVAYMISVKRVSLLFGILFGALIFGEPGLKTHLPAGALMLAGVVLIALG